MESMRFETEALEVFYQVAMHYSMGIVEEMYEIRSRFEALIERPGCGVAIQAKGLVP